MTMYALVTGTSGGEVFNRRKFRAAGTDHSRRQEAVNKVYAPLRPGCCLLKVRQGIAMKTYARASFGQEVQPDTYNLAA